MCSDFDRTLWHQFGDMKWLSVNWDVFFICLFCHSLFNLCKKTSMYKTIGHSDFHINDLLFIQFFFLCNSFVKHTRITFNVSSWMCTSNCYFVCKFRCDAYMFRNSKRSKHWWRHNARNRSHWLETGLVVWRVSSDEQPGPAVRWTTHVDIVNNQQ